jgi:hypothetical protein
MAKGDDDRRAWISRELLNNAAYGGMEAREAAFVKQGGTVPINVLNYRRKMWGVQIRRVMHPPSWKGSG